MYYLSLQVIDIEKGNKGDVVILVDEGGSAHPHTAHTQTVLEETKQAGEQYFWKCRKIVEILHLKRLTSRGDIPKRRA